MPTLDFKGRRFIENYHYSVEHHTFEFDPALSVLPDGENPSMDGNLIIEGDNLLALKSLLPTHAGRIKCIYMDPPYNTGNEGWVYNDNLTQPQFKEWIGKTVGNEADDATRHDKWCCMMMPRLYLIKELLSDDGVLFVSIDDNEVHHLRLLLDDVFDKGELIVSIIWKRRSTPPNDKVIGANHEYILVFCKNKQKRELYLKERSQEQEDRYSNPDNHPKGPWAAGDLLANVKGGRYVKSLYFAITNPDTGKQHFPPTGGNWRFNRSKIEELISNKEIYFGESQEGKPKLKRFRCDVKQGVSWASLWDFVPLNAAATAELSTVFDGETVFENPKPVGLIKELLKLGSHHDDIILDCTAGSGTTGHAVLQLNSEDGGARRFILTQQPYDTKSDENKGLNICRDITKERISRVIHGKFTGALEESFSYAKLSDRPLFGAYRELYGASYEALARYVFYTHTSSTFDVSSVDEETGFIGESNGTAVFLLYTPNDEIDRPLDFHFLETVAKKCNYLKLAVYAEAIAIHPADLRDWKEKHGRDVQSFYLPFELK